MVRRGILLGLCFVMVCLALTTNAFALNTERIDNSMYKLGRGMTNTAFCFLEGGRSLEAAVGEHGYLGGAAVGACEGVEKSLVRLGVGLFDILTFWDGKKDQYYMDPEFVVDA